MEEGILLVELHKAAKALAKGKVPGKDGILPTNVGEGGPDATQAADGGDS